MQKNIFLSVIIPAYNEEKRLPKTIKDIDDFLKLQEYESEIIVVDDGSNDSTVQLVKTFMEENPRLRLIENKVNKGKGFAVKTGMLESFGNYRLFTDADGSTPIGEVKKLFKNLDGGYDLAIGSRRVEGSFIKSEQSLTRLFLGRVFRELVNFLLPIGVIDSQNGFKLFTAKAARDIFPKQTIYGWAFDVEILFLAKKLGYKIKEVPIIWSDDRQSRVTLKGMIKMLWEVGKVRFGSKG